MPPLLSSLFKRPSHMATTQPSIAIVGSGLNGLCAAALAARRGAKVSLFEALPHLGGVARSLSWHDHTFSPGPQYTWGWQPDGPAWKAIEELELDLAMQPLPEDFDQVALQEKPFCSTQDALLDTLRTLPESQRARVDTFLHELTLAGNAGSTLGPDATYRHTATVMANRLLKTPLSLHDRKSLLSLCDTSLLQLARRHHLDLDTLRQLTHSQSIFAEPLSELSSLLFAAARHHLEEGVYFPRGGFASLIHELTRAALHHGANLFTNSPVVAIERQPNQRTQLTFTRQQETHTQSFDRVVWACSPGVLHHLLSHTKELKRLTKKLARFEAGHPVTTLCALIHTHEEGRRRLRHRNFTWVKTRQDIAFDPEQAASTPEILNFCSPTLNDGSEHATQVICAFSHASCTLQDMIAALRASLLKLDVPYDVLDAKLLTQLEWKQDFGAFQGAAYGRRLTARSICNSTTRHLPEEWKLSHSAASIPGVLGCLQTAKASIDELIPPPTMA